MYNFDNISMFKSFRDSVTTTKTQSSNPPSKGQIRIKVNDKVVYEGESGSVDVECKGNADFSSTTINGVTTITNGINVVVEGNVEGNVNAPMGVECGNVKGNVKAGMSVTCGDVGGNVDSGMSVTCKTVHGDVDAGMSITGL